MKKFRSFFQSMLVVTIASLFVMSIVYGATTIGSNVSTGGTLTVTGLSTLGQVTSDSVTSTAYMMVGSSGSGVGFLNYAGGDLYVQGGLEVDTGAWLSSATSSDSLAVLGYASTTGDLFVSGGTGSISTGTPTTTAGLFVGPTGSTGTTTLGVGDVGVNGCIELTKHGVWYNISMDDAGTALDIAAGRCK